MICRRRVTTVNSTRSTSYRDGEASLTLARSTDESRTTNARLRLSQVCWKTDKAPAHLQTNPIASRPRTTTYQLRDSHRFARERPQSPGAANTRCLPTRHLLISATKDISCSESLTAEHRHTIRLDSREVPVGFIDCTLRRSARSDTRTKTVTAAAGHYRSYRLTHAWKTAIARLCLYNPSRIVMMIQICELDGHPGGALHAGTLALIYVSRRKFRDSDEENPLFESRDSGCYTHSVVADIRQHTRGRTVTAVASSSFHKMRNE